jgi:two-component system cell cycle sensor histidine kinase/response regulator CckA
VKHTKHVSPVERTLLKKDRIMEKVKALGIGIVGGGPGCKAIIDMIFAKKLSQLRMKLIAVACTNPQAVGYRLAQEKGVFTTKDYHDLYELQDLDMIIELTGRAQVAKEISQTKPDNIQLMNHVAARLFWDVFQLEEDWIKERRSTEEALRESEERYRSVYETAPLAFVVWDPECRVMDWNECSEETFGWSREEVLGRNFFGFLVPESERPRVEDVVDNLLQGRVERDVVNENVTKTGDTILCRWNNSILRDREGSIIGAISLGLNITERKRADDALRASEEKYSTLVENSLTGIYIDQDGKIQFANRRFSEIYGYSENEVLGMETWRMVHPEDRDLTNEIRAKRIKGEQAPSIYEARGLTKDEKTIWIMRRNTRIEYKGRPAILGNIADTTDRKQTEEALRESEDKYRNLFNNAQVGLFRTRISDGKMAECNERLAKMFAYENREACIAQFVTSEHYLDPGTRERMVAEIQKNGEIHNFEARLSRRDGSIIWVRYSASVNPEKSYIEGVATDITEEKLAVEALVQAKEDWENTFDAITDMVMLLDSEHRIIRMNRSATEAFSTKKEGVVGKKCYEAVHGQSKPVKDCPLIATTRTGKPASRELTLSSLGRTCRCSTSPIIDQEGNLTGYTHSLRDITESKSLEAQLLQAQKMEAIGTLAGGIAHDFNNMLMGIQGNISLMLMSMDPSYPDYGRLENIEKQIHGGARLTSRLLGYARKGKYEVKPIDLNQLMEGTADTFGRTRKEITIHRELAKDLFAVEADSGQIEQVLLNLFVNAADAMPGGGELTLKTMNLTDKDMKGKSYEPKQSNYVLLQVTDTGMGIYKKTIDRIFDPFFTTKEIGGGTGLGLASAYGIIKAHSGYIDVASKRGRGTTFSIYLPSSKKEVKRIVRTRGNAAQGTANVLLVDDEGVVLKVGQELLEAMGYQVLTAKDGKEAITVYKKNRDKIDVVVLDMVMPRMGGGKTYDRMKEVNPDVKVLLSSGFSVDGEASEILERGCDGFIQKPFTMKQLSAKISGILG